MRGAAVAIVLVTALAAGCGGAGKPRFEPAAGWHVLSGHGELAAANVPFAAADRKLSSPPSRTVATLPRSGVLIWAMVARAGGYPPRPLSPPLRVSEASRSNPFEGFRCAPAVSDARCYAASGSIRSLDADVGGYDVELYVFFGTDRPASASLATANAELARLRLADPSPGCHVPAGPAYKTEVNPRTGRAGSTVTVSGPLSVVAPNGAYVGQTSTRIDVYWNLDFAKWWTALGSAPLASVAGRPVRRLGSEDVSKLCAYSVQVTVPSAPPGVYPIEVLYGNSHGKASLSPVRFRIAR